MTWAKLDDRFPNHRKVAAAGGDAAWLYVAGLCYCQAQLTDGHIPDGIIARLTDRKAPVKLAARLVEVRLWERVEGGYRVHDFLDHNLSADDVRAKRQQGTQRIAQWRAQRSGNGVGNAVTDGVGNAVGNFNPTPTPTPTPTKAKTEKLLSAVADAPPHGRFDFAAVYAKYPRRKGDPGKKRGLEICARQIKSEADYRRLVAAVERYARERSADVGTEFIPMFSTWMGTWTDFDGPAPDIAPATAGPRPPRIPDAREVLEARRLAYEADQ